MDVGARVPRKPSLDGRGLGRAVIVHHEMDFQTCREVNFSQAQEVQELAVAMSPLPLANDLASGDVERCKQRRRPVAVIVMGAPLSNSRCQK